jgi:hypothetical protein
LKIQYSILNYIDFRLQLSDKSTHRHSISVGIDFGECTIHACANGRLARTVEIFCGHVVAELQIVIIQISFRFKYFPTVLTTRMTKNIKQNNVLDVVVIMPIKL